MVFDIFGAVVQMGIGSVARQHLALQLEWLIYREVVSPRGTASRYNALIRFHLMLLCNGDS
jgi:hypothetical protein